MGMIGDLFIKLGFDKKDFDKGVEETKQKLTGFKGVISSIGSAISDIFGSSLDLVKQKLSSLGSATEGVVGSFKLAANGGREAQIANEALSKANGQLLAAQKASEAAQVSLTALQATGTATELELAAAKREVAITSKAVTSATTAQATAQAALTAATSATSIALKILRVALISTGVGALVVALGSLVAYFMQTERGAESLERAMAKIKAVFQVIIDRAAKMGEGLMLIATGKFSAGWDALKDSVSGIGAEMAREAKIAGDLEAAYQDLEDKERDLIEVNAKRREEASRMKLASRDLDKSLEERKSSLLRAIELEKAAFKDEKEVATEKARIYKAQIMQGEVRDDQLKKSAELNASVTDIQGKANEAHLANMRYLNSLTAQQKEYNKALAETNEQLSKPLKAREEITGSLKTNKTTVEGGLFKSSKKGIMDTQTSDLGLAQVESQMTSADAKLAISYERIKERTNKFNEDFNGLIQSGLGNAATTFGEGLGALITGDMNFKDFGKSLLAVVGQFLVQLGQLMITLGIGMTGLKAAISSMNPVLAIGAGVALVAAGSAIASLSKKGLSGSGGGGSASGGGSYVAPSNGRQSQAEDNKVVFEIQGSKLVGVLNNAEKRKLNLG